MTTYYHGSGSASLVGVLDETSPGLMPLGQMLKEGKVPYGGEIGFGSVGINKSSISTVPYDTIKVAIYHCLDFGMQAWNPKIGKYKIQSLRETRRSIEIQLGSKDLQDWLREYRQIELLANQMNENIQHLRLKDWENLTAQQKKLITNPFPLIYSMDYEGEVRRVFSERPLEAGIPATISSQDLGIYVPQKRLSLVKELTKGLNKKVNPFAALKSIQGLPLDCERAIEELIRRTK